MNKKKLVVLTGAGISAESGIKTFRDSDGLWEGYNVHEVASPAGFAKNPQLVLDFYNLRRRDIAAAKPNRAHEGLAELEENFDVTIITQNIDDLHERAGSSKVVHLHGEIFKMHSVTNPNVILEIRTDIQVGELAEDGGQLRPHIVWFGEQVPMIEVALEIMSIAEIFVVIGTSLLVYPAAGLINYAPAHIPKFIIDKSIPYTGTLPGITAIKKPATEGLEDLKRLLRALV